MTCNNNNGATYRNNIPSEFIFNTNNRENESLFPPYARLLGTSVPLERVRVREYPVYNNSNTNWTQNAWMATAAPAPQSNAWMAAASAPPSMNNLNISILPKNTAPGRKLVEISGNQAEEVVFDNYNWNV